MLIHRSLDSRFYLPLTMLWLATATGKLQAS